MSPYRKFSKVGNPIYDLSWSNHMNHTANKTNGILNKLKNVIPKHILINIHYCILAWGFKTDRLFNLQKKSVRIISKSHFLAHTNPLFKEFKILKVDGIFKQHQFTFYNKFKKNSLPVCLANILTNQEANVRQCHTSFFLKPPNRVNLECTKLCIRHSIPQLINTYDTPFVDSIGSLSLPALKRMFKLSSEIAQ